MSRAKRRLGLGREALLYDSPLYILKAFVGVFIAYALFSQQSFVGKDMISVLFGFMLTLEPMSVTGIRSGIDQVLGSLLGGVVGFCIVSIGGVNWLTVPLAVALSLYIALMLGWKAVPAVTIFTAIYMTQYVQYDAYGMPSMLLTLALRLSALTSGILVAVLLNAVFSKFFYRKMVSKRLIASMLHLNEVLDKRKDSSKLEWMFAIVEIQSELSVINAYVQTLTLRGHHKLNSAYEHLIDALMVYCIERQHELQQEACDLTSCAKGSEDREILVMGTESLSKMALVDASSYDFEKVSPQVTVVVKCIEEIIRLEKGGTVDEME